MTTQTRLLTSKIGLLGATFLALMLTLPAGSMAADGHSMYGAMHSGWSPGSWFCSSCGGPGPNYATTSGVVNPGVAAIGQKVRDKVHYNMTWAPTKTTLLGTPGRFVYNLDLPTTHAGYKRFVPDRIGLGAHWDKTGRYYTSYHMGHSAFSPGDYCASGCYVDPDGDVQPK